MPCHVVVATILRRHGETGVQAHVEEAVKALRASGVNVEVVTPFQFWKVIVYPVFGARRIIDGLSSSLSVWWYRYWHGLFLFLELRHRLAHGRTVTVYAQCPVSAAAALRARRSPGQRVTLVVHFNISQADEWAEKGAIRQGGAHYLAIRKFEDEVLLRVDGLVFVSAFMQQSVERRQCRFNGVTTRVIPNFVACDPMDPISEIAGDLITIGTLEPRKNQAYLLRVLAEAGRAGKRYTLNIVGSGPDENKLRKLANELGLDSQVRFLGYLPNASRLLSGHRAYCHVATIENLPMVLLEAMCRGRPILAGAVGGIPEIVADGETGVLWPLDDPAAAAGMLINLMDDEARIARMAASARARFERCLSVRVAGEALRRFLCDEVGLRTDG